MTEKEMQMESVHIVTRFMEKNVTNAEGMVILAMSLATTFKVNGVSQHEAINRFTTIVKEVYGALK
jgi:hypothetical protein